MAKCLVTGGAGFIGSNVALELEKLGHDVIASDNFHSADRGNLNGFNGQLITWDCADKNLPPGNFDFIFHQAAITDPRHPDDKETYLKNVSGFNNVLKLQERTGARVVYASTAGLYGNGPTPMKEDQPKDCITVYGESKWRMDQLAEGYFAERPLIGLRYFNVFGPREAHKGRPASMVLHLYHQMKAGKRPRLFKQGEHTRDFIYVKDAVAANLCALQAPSGVYNVGTGVGTTFNQVVETLNALLGTKFEPEYFDMPYDSKTYQHHTIADVTKARERLKFTARYSFKEAVKDYIQWIEGDGDGQR